MQIFKKKYTSPKAREYPPLSQRPEDEPVYLSKGMTQLRKSKSYSSKANTNQNKSASTPELIYRVMSKMGYGPSPEDLAHIQSLPGANPQAKVLAYIDEQLNPEAINDNEMEARLNSGFGTLNKTVKQLYQEHYRAPNGDDIPYSVEIRPRIEVLNSTFLRANYSKRQLKEVLADFWHNHFNVYAATSGVHSMFVQYDRDVIRANVLGNFRDMLYEVTRSTSMMMYLGNAVNNVVEPNENFAREILELHTIGAANYFGHMDHEDVPVDGQGRKLGYVEEDVYYMARVLTGWSYDGAHWSDDDNGHAPTGEFKYRDDWHYDGISRIMGQYFEFDTAAGQEEKDVNDVLDMLAEHPLTAQFLAQKLCRRFISDNPANSIVNQVADVLHQNWQAADQIKQAMEVLLKSNEFLNTWGEKIKRPFERAVSAMRAVGYEYSFNPDDNYTNTHRYLFDDTGQMPFQWSTPNGYPDVKSHWLGTSSMMATWRYIQWLCRERDDSDTPLNDILNRTVNHFTDTDDITPVNLVDYWFPQVCGAQPDAHTKNKLVEFMAYIYVWDNQAQASVLSSINEDDVIDLSTNGHGGYNQERLMAMVTLILLTADFSYR